MEDPVTSLTLRKKTIKVTNTQDNSKSILPSQGLNMFNITFPDGSVKTFDEPLTVFEVAKSISPSLAKKAVAGKVNGKLVDTFYIINDDATLTIITPQDEEGLEIIRHSAAHLLAQAVKQLFPDAEVTIGPVIEDGFYYDFSYKRPFTPEDMEKIEQRMNELKQQNLPVTKRTLSRDDAIKFFQGINENYKVKIIKDIDEDQELTLYKQGDFEDLCRGPHVPSTGFIKAFKLTKLAGAYWRGDVNNEMLQRIYGTAWASKEDLDLYLKRLEEAEKRDHRRLGKALELFHFQDIAPGMVFWHPNGWALYEQIQNYIKECLCEFEYDEVRTPQVVDKILWEKSGHWDNFRDQMFLTETENRVYAIKPMSCPCHVQIFNQGIKSYRDLPLRMSEFGNCHRSEPSGALHGLMRVRNFLQDDAHIFCTEDQLNQEVFKILEMVKKVYHDFGFDEIIYRLALRPDKRVGSDAIWDKAEDTLRSAMQQHNISWVEAPGEGAFYGPKIECSLSDSLGRIWQCGTIQIDFSTPEKLDAQFVSEDGSKKYPVMIHRAILGSFERFIGILIEHYAGLLPLWLSPVQVSVLNISEKQDEYSQKIHDFLQKNRIRSKLDLRNEKIGFKIRKHTLKKVPYLIIIGDKEVEQNLITIRDCSGENLGSMPIEDFYKRLQSEIIAKRRV